MPYHYYNSFCLWSHALHLFVYMYIFYVYAQTLGGQWSGISASLCGSLCDTATASSLEAALKSNYSSHIPPSFPPSLPSSLQPPLIFLPTRWGCGRCDVAIVMLLATTILAVLRSEEGLTIASSHSNENTRMHIFYMHRHVHTRPIHHSPPSN